MPLNSARREERFVSPLVVPLGQPRDQAALRAHFASLGSEDLRHRFCRAIKPASVRAYLMEAAAAHVASYGVYAATGDLAAACQLAPQGVDLEVGLSVLPAFRRQGLAAALLVRAMAHARERGHPGLIIHSLADNTAMLCLARRMGMTIQMLQGDADGRLSLRTEAREG